MSENFKIICPICGRSLTDNGKSFLCQKGHCFDRARQGYINLLPVQNKHSLSPGDARDMLLARRAFLDRNYYQPLCTDAAEKILLFCKTDTPLMVDVGCGEGYYTAAIEKSCHARCIGMDIAKDAAKMACARSKTILWTVGTASHIPLESENADVVLAIFSLFVNDEYARILKKGGIVVEVTAGSGHLTELKNIIYEDVFEQDKHPAPFGEQFELCLMEENKFTFELNNEALRELLAMTPHSRRMKKERMEQVCSIEKLALTADYIIRVLRKK